MLKAYNLHSNYCLYYPGWQTAALVCERARPGPIEDGTGGEEKILLRVMQLSPC